MSTKLTGEFTRIARTVHEAEFYASEHGYPIELRPAFTMSIGPTIVTNKDALVKEMRDGLEISPTGEVQMRWTLV